MSAEEEIGAYTGFTCAISPLGAVSGVCMTKVSDKFEQQIARIYSLIEQDGSEVTWNDKIPDPDRPAQLRQIDVSVRRDGALTLIECRFHKHVQDVNWIEELIGGRSSLAADTVIAVSVSGFMQAKEGENCQDLL